MELKEFVKKALLDITNGVEEASKEACRKIEISETQKHRSVEFDVAVSAEETAGASGKAGVKVWAFVEASGNMNAETKNSTVSRIAFGVNIDCFTKEERANEN